MDPVIAEICRNHETNVRPGVLRRWQRYLRDDVQPRLDRLAALEANLAGQGKSPAPKEHTT